MMSYELSDDEPELETLDISNDYYYQHVACRTKKPPVSDRVPHSKSLQIPSYGSTTIRHSLPAYDLWKPFFPTYLSDVKFRNFHRPKLRHFNNGPQAKGRHDCYPHQPVKSLTRNIFRSHHQLKSKIVKAIHDGLSRDDIISKFLLIKSARELTAKTGEIILFEYCEEYPPVLSQIGMASNVKIYSYGKQILSSKKGQKRNIRGKVSVPTVERVSTNQLASPAKPFRQIGFEEMIKDEKHSKRIYYNPMRPGTNIRMIENNLYRAPIFEHDIQSCDFLVVRTRNSFYIREVKTIYTVGQTLPLAVIPAPTENNIQKFRCDLSNVYIHRLFKASEADPPFIKLDNLARLFPDYDKSILQRRIRSGGAESASIGDERVFVLGKSLYGALDVLSLRNLMHPEGYCLNMSMLAARQRLRELNYSETMIHPSRSVELETEVLAAPWNTSKAVMNAMMGRSYLELEKHLIDPTGPSREGFSCVAMVKSPTEIAQAKEIEARNSTPSQDHTSSKPFLGTNPMRAKITLEKIKRLALFQREAQLISEIQSRCLSLDDALTSSEEEDNDDDIEGGENMSESDFSQQLDTLNRMVLEGRSNLEVTHENEEAERRQMLIELGLNQNRAKNEQSSPAKQQDDCDPALLKDKVLYITRTYEYGGKRVQRSEIVRDRRIIALYVKQKGGSLLNIDRPTNDGDKQQSNECNGKMSNRYRPRSTSLGPTELCRAEGTVLRISKKVLESIHPARSLRRQSYGA